MQFSKKIILNKTSRIFPTIYRNFLISFKPQMDVDKLYKVYPVKDKPLLTDNENSLFDLLRLCVKEEGLKTTLRVAGGWVRDKLLGKDCKDIDIAIDDMTGEEFLKKAKEFFKKKGIDDIHGFGVIKTNPDKSKHLETATVKIKDIWVDFVNLRGETYDPDTRVPTMRIGTAEEDAFRRDLTINSLFYNLMTESVEDFTKRGLEDLRNGIIRTPLKPYTTFFDDPLRILRTFRFASRFSFRVENDIIEALKSQEILNGLRTKVSRERVGIELNLILNNESSFDCLTYYFENGLWDIVFEVKSVMKDMKQDLIDDLCKTGYGLCKTIYRHREMLEKFEILNKAYTPKQVLFYAYLTAAILPFSLFKFEKNKQTPSLMSYIVKESIKFTNKDLNMVMLLESSIELIDEMIKNPHDQKNKTIRWIKTNGDSWELAFFLSYMKEKQVNCSPETSKNYDELYKFVFNEKLSLIFTLKPLLDGGEIIKLMQIKPGPMIKTVQDNIFKWQVENQEKGKEELIKEINNNKEAFLIRYE